MKPIKVMFGVIGAIAGLVVAVWLVSLLPGSLNPFKTENKDRSQPAVLQSISDIGQYRASSANLQIVVDLEKDTKWVPDFIKGERVLFVAAGAVDAGVDFTKLTRDSVKVEGTTATITLPDATLFTPQVDLDKSYVVDRKRGVIDRIGAAFGDGGDQRDVYTMAERKLRDAAAADPRVLARAKDNTERMLTALLTSLGFTKVTVDFLPAPGT